MKLSRTLAAAWLCATTSALQAQPLQSLEWLSGRWLETTERGQTEELWTQPRGEMMAAANTAVRGGRASFEFLRIVARDGRLVLLASPGGRMPPTEFVLQDQAGQRVVFENPTHDFPTRIVYSREGEQLTARIEGQINGQPRSIQWVFRRTP